MSIGYGPKVATDGLVLSLDAANQKSYPGSGTEWKDLSGNGYDGTLLNGVDYDTANGGSLVFDGVDDRVSGLLPFTGDQSEFSTSVWFRALERTDSYDGIIQIEGTGTGSYVGGVIISFSNNDENLRIRHWNDGGTNYSWSSSPIGNWKNIVLIVKNKLITVYDNNQLVVDSTYINDFDFSGSYRIGQYTFQNNYFSGKISSVQIYNRALSPQEIQQNFQSLRGRYGL